MSEDTLYSVRVTGPSNEMLIQITGSRETVLDASLRVILDQAPMWAEAARWPQPAFKVDVHRMERRG